jgi:hypothetical protein
LQKELGQYFKPTVVITSFAAEATSKHTLKGQNLNRYYFHHPRAAGGFA